MRGERLSVLTSVGRGQWQRRDRASGTGDAHGARYPGSQRRVPQLLRRLRIWEGEGCDAGGVTPEAGRLQAKCRPAPWTVLDRQSEGVVGAWNHHVYSAVVTAWQCRRRCCPR